MHVIWQVRNKVRFGGSFDVADTIKLWETWVDKFSSLSKEKPSKAINIRRKDSWNLPQTGGIAVNVDAAWMNGNSAMSVVVQDHKGGLILVAASIVKTESAMQA